MDPKHFRADTDKSNEQDPKHFELHVDVMEWRRKYTKQKKELFQYQMRSNRETIRQIKKLQHSRRDRVGQWRREKFGWQSNGKQTEATAENAGASVERTLFPSQKLVGDEGGMSGAQLYVSSSKSVVKIMHPLQTKRSASHDDRKMSRPTYVVTKTIPKMKPIPTSTAWINLRNNYKVEDDPDLQFIPYFGEDDTEDVVSDVYEVGLRTTNMQPSSCCNLLVLHEG